MINQNIILLIFFYYSPPIIWKEILATKFSKHLLDELLSTFAMDDIILSIGWAMGLMVLRQFLTLLQLLAHSGIFLLMASNICSFKVVFIICSEPMWPIEARNAAIANTYFVACNNRVGTVSLIHLNIVVNDLVILLLGGISQ